MEQVEKALILGRALGLAEGGWPNDTLDSLNKLPDLREELIARIQAENINSNFGLDKPMREIIQRELKIKVEE